MKVGFIGADNVAGTIGRGDIAGTGYFKLLKELNYHTPISLHIEF
jgi:hypothetical protein